MNSPSDSINKPTDSFMTRVMDLDTDTKNNIINAIQFIVFTTIPVALIDLSIKHLFSNNNPASKGSAELLAEIAIQLCATILLAIVTSKIIYAIPTYSTTAYQPLNYINLSFGFLLLAFSTNHSNITDKFKIIMARLNESWSDKTTAPKNNKNSVSVSKPISGMVRQPPAHQNSRADIRSPVRGQEPPPIVPNGAPSPPPSFNEDGPTSQNMYGGPENSIVGADFPSQEPMAANMAFGVGGFSSW